jgi:hypothetical protein
VHDPGGSACIRGGFRIQGICQRPGIAIFNIHFTPYGRTNLVLAETKPVLAEKYLWGMTRWEEWEEWEAELGVKSDELGARKLKIRNQKSEMERGTADKR